MGGVLQRLTSAGLVVPPTWLPQAIQYEVINGSYTYGVSTDDSDFDVYGFCIPHLEMIFPHLSGEIEDFDKEAARFHSYQQHHIHDPSARVGLGQDYDVTIYNIVRFLRLCMEGNPNMVNSLFAPRDSILFSTRIGEFVREHRKLFLHKGCWHKYKGYSYSQMHKMRTSKPIGKRVATVAKYGYDVKFGYHVVRLLLEVEQILTEGDLDLRRHSEQLKAIRRGEWTQEKLIEWAGDKEKALEKAYEESSLPWGPDTGAIKAILLEALRMHFGTLEGKYRDPGAAEVTIEAIGNLIELYRRGQKDVIIAETL